MGWLVDLHFGRVVLSNSSMVSDTMITMPVRRRTIVGHVVIAHVIVPRVLWLTQSSGIFDEWRHILPGLILAMITSSIRCCELETAHANESL
jgi:hypothetical protein